jgi:hypothetical protein
MFAPSPADRAPVPSLDALDRLAIGYLALPLVLFLGGWLRLWVALPLLACAAYSLRCLVGAGSGGPLRFAASPLQIAVAVSVACAWTLLGGADHVFFANADWHVRDAVLHDLVVSPWPVGYGPLQGLESLLRAPVAFYLPAALVGKIAGLPAAYVAMGLWTVLGTSLFLIQVLSLTPPRLGVAVAVTAVIVFFSGLDIIGNLLNDGPRFRSDWNITTHLEWWAGKYQYSSMTTQLFWVPNHALGGWLLIGLFYRNPDNTAFDATLPICVVALALWSPLTALGILPFVLWKLVRAALDARLGRLIHPARWLPACAVGLVVAGYLVLDTGGVPKGVAVGATAADVAMDLAQQTQFFLLEAGFVGAAIFWIRRSAEVALALVVLALLPFVYLGGGNDLVMRASIPSLAVLAIGAGRALWDSPATARPLRKALVLGGLLAVGAITPVAEFARAVILPAWPINRNATLIGVACGAFAPSYVARLDGQPVERLLRPPNRLDLGPMGPASCDNPALDLMWAGNVR